MLREKLHIFGILGCILCVVGSTTIVLHAPPERQIESVAEVWDLATEPGTALSPEFGTSWVKTYWFVRHFSLTIISILIYQVLRFKLCPAAFLFYAAVVLAASFVLIFHFVPQYGQTHIMVYIGICSLVGSLSVSFSWLTVIFMWIHIAILEVLGYKCSPYVFVLVWQVMSVKALGIALKLTFSGMNQLVYPQTWVFSFVVISCIVTQMNYLNKVWSTLCQCTVTCSCAKREGFS